MDAIQGVPMGTENKIGVHFRQDIFGPGTSGYSQSGSTEIHGVFIEVNLSSTRVVTVFIGGRFGVWMESQGQRAATEFAIDRIAEIIAACHR
ncbi:MAG: hypothetical protein ACI9IN_001185 [Porticoccaceae bacterium]|jgi:hypothetical protein